MIQTQMEEHLLSIHECLEMTISKWFNIYCQKVPRLVKKTLLEELRCIMQAKTACFTVLLLWSLPVLHLRM